MHGQRPVTTGMLDAPQAEHTLKLEYDAATGELLRAKGTIGTVRDKGDAMRLLVVEDNPELGQQLRRRLESEGHAVDLAADGEEGQFLGETKPYDVIILDLGLPKIDGLTVLRSWRRKGVTTPVLILTARGAWNEKVEGIDAGADDYLTKPFSFAELLARLKAIQRRFERQVEPPSKPFLAVADLELDLRTKTAKRGGRELALTATEFALLERLMRHPGRVQTRGDLLRDVWERRTDLRTNVVDVYVRYLRHKIDKHGEPPLIRTVRGFGYTIEAPAPPDPGEAG